MKAFYIINLLFVTALISCGNNQNRVTQKMNDSVKCIQYPDHFYAVYLPDSILTGKQYPVFYLFDAGGSAKKMVEQYKNLADKYDIILASSYNIKNGPYNTNVDAAKSFIDDVSERYPVNREMQFIAGFSGGSRIAYAFSGSCKDISGVISIGAFINSGTNFYLPEFNLSGICGTSDFNFREGVAMNYLMHKNRKPFQFIVYEGEHAWPPDSIFECALVYQLFQVLENNALARKYIQLEDVALKESYKNNDLINASRVLGNMSLVDPEYLQELDQLVLSPDFKNQARLFEKSMKYEDSLKKVIEYAAQGLILSTKGGNNFYKPLNWWKSEIESFQKGHNNIINLYQQQATKRALSYIGIILWQINRQTFKEKNYGQALEAAEILCLAYPENPTYLALKAESLFMLNKVHNSEVIYKKAIETGFTLEDEFLGKSPVIQNLNKLVPVKGH